MKKWCPYFNKYSAVAKCDSQCGKFVTSVNKCADVVLAECKIKEVGDDKNK